MVVQQPDHPCTTVPVCYLVVDHVSAARSRVWQWWHRERAWCRRRWADEDVATIEVIFADRGALGELACAVGHAGQRRWGGLARWAARWDAAGRAQWARA